MIVVSSSNHCECRMFSVADTIGITGFCGFPILRYHSTNILFQISSEKFELIDLIICTGLNISFFVKLWRSEV